MKTLRIVTTEDPAELCTWVAARLAELPPVLERHATLLTDSAPLLHQLRRHCVLTLRRPGLLLGVTSSRPAGLAFEILARSGRVAIRGGEHLRRLELLRLFEAGVLEDRLSYFAAEELRRPGYVDVFARTIGDLEMAGLTAADLAQQAEAPRPVADARRLVDLRTIWQAVDDALGELSPPCLTRPAAFRRAADEARRNPALVESFTPIVAVLTTDPSMSLLDFLAALPAACVLLLEGRPPRKETQRWRGRVGSIAPWIPAPPAASRSGSDSTAIAISPDGPDAPAAPPELARLRRRLFLAGEGPDSPASDGSDDAAADLEPVDLEQYAGVEDEVEASAAWVIEQVADGVPLEEIAIIATDVDTYGPLLEDRLRRVPTNGDEAGERGGPPPGIRLQPLDGRLARRTPAGARVLAVLRALESALPAVRMIPVLQALRHDDESDAPESAAAGTSAAGSSATGTAVIHSTRTPSAVARLVHSAGIAGGSVARPEGALEWVACFESFRRRLQAEFPQAEEPGSGPLAAIDEEDEPEKRRHVRARREAADWLRLSQSFLPGLRELEQIAGEIHADASLARLWPLVAAWLRSRLRIPPAPPGLLDRFAAALDAVLPSPAAEQVRGKAAVRYLIAQLERLRVPIGDRSEPAVTLASAAAARGLRFHAVRIIGLAEGQAPRSPRDDPVLPAELRRELEQQSGAVIERVEDRILGDLHDLCRVMMGARHRLTLSAPRQWTDGSNREVSGVLLEVAMALARPGADAEAPAIPTAAHLRTIYMAAAAARREERANALPVLPVGVFDAIGSPAGWSLGVPPPWLEEPDGVIDPPRLRRLDAERADPRRFASIDGILAPVWRSAEAPGISPDRPLSPSRLGQLLGCPHAFMLQQVLGFAEPAAAPSTDRIDPLQFGSLAHRILEILLGEAGTELCNQQGTLKAWLERVTRVAKAEFDTFLGSYPLRGRGATERERRRLIDTVRRFVRYEWGRERRTFVAVERDFGDPRPVTLKLGGQARLHVRGIIDRLDRLADGSLSVRDFKTGKAHPLAREPVAPGFDLQIALYARVLEESGAELSAAELSAVGLSEESGTAAGVRVGEAVYVYAVVAREAERRFAQATLADLRQRLDRWLHVAHALLAAGQFPRTPFTDDCRFCPFVPFCGSDAQTISAAKLGAAELPPAVAAFGALRTAPDEPEDR